MKICLNRLWKYKKILLYGILAFFVGQVCFFGMGKFGMQNEVFAADTTTQNENDKSIQKLQETEAIMSFLHKVIYVFLYPILILAGKLVDNSFVYWEIFWFDAVLWELWVIVRNLANFGLWFIFIFYIFKYLIKKDDKTWPKWIIKNALIAWILIQASWFIMAALIDVSTILTYAVWWLPITVLDGVASSSWSENEDKDNAQYNPYSIWLIVDVDAGDVDSYDIYLSNQNMAEWESNRHFIAPCVKFPYNYKDKNGQDMAEDLILAPQKIYYKDFRNGITTYYPTEKYMCHLDGSIYHFPDNWVMPSSIQWPEISNAWNSWGGWNAWEVTDKNDWENLQIKYTAEVDLHSFGYQNETKENIEELICQWYLLKAYTSSISSLWDGCTSEQNFWIDMYNEQVWKEWNLPRLSSLLEGNYYAWVFGSLYSSLIEAWMDLRFSSTTDEWIYSRTLNTFMSLWHMLAIAIPLLVMLFVFMMRIWVIWAAIVLSPLIALLTAFDLFDGLTKSNRILEHFKISNLIWIIFSPAVVCFAISMSTVLVRIIMNVNANEILTSSTPILWWIIKLNIAGVWVNVGKLVCSVIWIAITWFLVWTALKASTLWKTMEKVQKFAENALWSMPIVPIPGMNEAVWLNAIFGNDGREWILSTSLNTFKTKYDNKSSQVLNEWLDPETAAKNAENAQKAEAEKAHNTQITNYSNQLIWMDNITRNWVSEEITVGDQILIFNNLWDGDKEKIINSINAIEDVNKRAKFGEAGDIKIWSKTWTFNNIMNKYTNHS